MKLSFTPLLTLICAISFAPGAAQAQMSNDQMQALIQGLHGAPTNWIDIDTRINEVSNKIDQFCATGAAPQVNDLRTRFAKILQLQSQGKTEHPKTPTLVSSLNITKELNRICVIMRDAPPSITSADSINKWRSDLTNLIDSAVNAVLLTRLDAAKLKTELNSTAAAQAALVKNGSLSADQLQACATSLQAVSAHFDQMLKMAQSCISDLNKREVDIQIRIDNGERSQQLNHALATGFRRRLDLITKRQSNYVESNTDAPLSASQVFDLATQIDQLQSQVDQATAASD